MKTWPLFISFRYFVTRRKEGMISLIGGISVLGVALGVASLIIVISIMNGFDLEIRKKIIGTYAHITVIKGGGITRTAELMSRLRSMPEVRAAAGFVTGQAILRTGTTATGILLKGIDVEKESQVTEVIKYAREFDGTLDGKTIILGSELIKNARLSMGDIVEILIPHSETDLERTKLKIVGSFTSGRYDYDANIAICGLETAQKLFRTKNSVTGIGLRLDDEMKVEEMKHRLQASLKYPYVVKSWMDFDRNLVAALAMEKKMMFVILALIVMVACFNIAGSLIMMVMEKTRDIGILKAIGANSLSINIIFLLQSAIVGLVGIIMGTLAGIFIANRINVLSDFIERATGFEVFPSDVYYFTEIPVEISAVDVTMIVSVAAVLTLVAGIYPARKASRLDPVEAIRYE